MSSEDDERIIWQPDAAFPACFNCEAPFGLVTRRHHCRLCGFIFCDTCSSIRLTHVATSSDDHQYRICRICCDELEEEEMVIELPPEVSQSLICGMDSLSRLAGSVVRRPTDGSGLWFLQPPDESDGCTAASMASLSNCPVCSLDISRMSTDRSEVHMAQCLESKRKSVIGNAYTVSAWEKEDGKECEICYEELRQGQKVAVLNCLCQFHLECIRPWFEKGKACPFHYA